jgi:hypothetical protein
MQVASGRFRCDVCNEVTGASDILSAENPWDSDQGIWGCPNCKSANEFTRVCDVDGCSDSVLIGSVAGDGLYHFRCMEHI